MGIYLIAAVFMCANLISSGSFAQSGNNSYQSSKNLYMDVHHFGAGKVNYKAVAEAHAKDLTVEKKYDVHFLKYWIDKKEGNVYCLSLAKDTGSIKKTHAEAHGLIPGVCYPVTEGPEASTTGKKEFFLDIHEVGSGKVTAKDVAAAHKKDLQVQKKHGVNFVNYYLNEKEGIVMCMAEARNSVSVIKTHKEAHGLVPVKVMKVKQGE